MLDNKRNAYNRRFGCHGSKTLKREKQHKD